MLVFPVLYNLYGPCVGGDDSERIQFKLTFYKVLQVMFFFSSFILVFSLRHRVYGSL